ncbi:MAG: Crp/Fnr family transcriptional regulator [Bacteroidota bacterium]
MTELLKNIMPPDRIDELISIGQAKTVNSTEYFVRAGEIPRKLAFVISGLFRYVYISNKGSEFTKGIITENNFISSYSAMITKSPSHFFIEALENSEIFEISYEKWLILLETDTFWIRFLLGYIEKAFSIKEKRERDLLLLDAETRYDDFMKEFPGIQKRIKQNIIASYLGIQPESLSRIKKKKST